eukprot:7322720-Alexandrium_andersonii.AAC.1
MRLKPTRTARNCVASSAARRQHEQASRKRMHWPLGGGSRGFGGLLLVVWRGLGLAEPKQPQGA